MAVAFDVAASAASTTGTLSAALTIANNRDRYLVAVFVEASNGYDPTISSVVWNTSENLTLLAGPLAEQDERMWIYGLKNPTATSSNVVVTWGGSAPSGSALVAAAFYNVDQTNPTGTSRTNQSTTGNTSWVSTDYSGRPGGVVVGGAFRERTAAASTATSDVNGIPEYIAAGTLSTATAQTSRTPAAPAGAIRGDLEIAHCSSENNATHSVSGSGWVKIGQTNSGASYTVSHYYRIHTGTNVNPVISWTGSVDASARRYLFRDTRAKATVAAPVAYHGTVGTGTTSPHTSTGANTTEDDVLAIYIDICNANTAMVAETSWTERVDSGSATGPVRSYLADREMATSGSATGNISETGGAAAYVQQQFEIYNADNGDQIALGEQENVDGGFVAFSASYEVADDYNTLGWTYASGTTAGWAAIAIPLNPTVSLPPFNRPARFMPRRAA